MTRASSIAAVIFSFISICLFAQSSPQDRLVLDGVYTAEQADKGGELYEANCTVCHEGNDPPGPALIGRSFIDRWREDNLDVLYNYMKTRMPADNAGKLEDDEYIRLLAFLLQANGYAEGTRPLEAGGVSHIRLVGKDGPKPLPPNSLVKVVGCLNQNAAGSWLLEQASEPVRSHNGNENTPAELKESASKPRGTQSFSLQNFTNIRFDFQPDPFKGHRVQVKGALLRQSTGDRISLTSLETVATDCGR
jgi:mono/diheme cytochrome c family protein